MRASIPGEVEGAEIDYSQRPPHSSVELNDLAARMEDEAARFVGRVGYMATNLATGETVSRLENELFPTASAVKLPVLTAFHSFVEGGNVGWSDYAHVRAEDVPGGSGVLQHLDLPREITYRDAAWLMICVSDNMATNILLRAMGLDQTNSLISEIVGPDIHVNKYAGFQPGQPVRSMGDATPKALGRYLNRLANHRLPGAAETLRVAEEQVYRNTIPRYLPYDSFAMSTIQIANKTGALPGVRTDIAVLTGADTVVTMAFMTADAEDKGDTVENEAQRCIGRLALLVYNSWLVKTS